MIDIDDTIAAIASPPGVSDRGIVRLTGPAAIAAASSGFLEVESGGLAGSAKSARRKTGQYRVDGFRNRVEADLLIWPSSRTYTGQPIAEIHTIGSPVILGLLLAAMLEQGARLAEPGEFTLRAFLNGKLDLTRAEAVLGVIESRNAGQLEASLKQLAGGLFEPIKRLRDQLLDTLAHLEANLDFMDEPDVDPLGRLALAKTLAEGASDLGTIAKRLTSRDRADGHPRVVLIGPPNVGKSSLFNVLLGTDRAIISPIAGTTRDYLSNLCDCDGLTIELIDTAGEESAHDQIDQDAQAQRHQQSKIADLLLICSTTSQEMSKKISPDRPTLHIRTKSDLSTAIDQSFRSKIAVSAQTGKGLEDLKRAIATAVLANENEGDLPTTTAARCRESLVRAAESLDRAAGAIADELGDELVSVDLRQAVDDLGRVVGEIVTDDILDRIFKRFCIGK